MTLMPKKVIWSKKQYCKDMLRWIAWKIATCARGIIAAYNLMEKGVLTLHLPLTMKSLTQGYIVLNRPWAFVQCLQKANIQEEYILMAEPDHLIVKPIPNLPKQLHSLSSTLNQKSLSHNGLITDINSIGNSPVIVEKLAMKKDPEADKAFGWVLEMYAYAVASALHGVGNILHKDFMTQPPSDLEVGEKFIIHYTYGCDYDLKGQSTYGKIGEWRFDKRSYDRKPPPRNLALPPPGAPQSVVWLQSHSKSNQGFNLLELNHDFKYGPIQI